MAAAEVYPSRVDAWLVAVLALAVGLCVWQGLAMGSVLSLAIGAATLAAVLALTVPCRYTLEADHLAVRCGLIRQRVPYARIRGVQASRNPLSAPALSLRRVKITLERGFVLVSPRERERFMVELRRRAGLTGQQIS
jgi:membrane protein YdbS with pleckstrin-like domain